MQVFVLTKEVGNDIRFRIVTSEHSLSEIITLENKACFFGGNPYSIYGDHVEEYIGVNKYDVSITVCKATSGVL